MNLLPFAVSMSSALRLDIAEAIKNCRAATILRSIKGMKDIYSRRGLLMNTVLADNEFATLERPLGSIGVTLNILARDEHVPEVERYIRILKERCRAMFNLLPFNRMPRCMIVELVYAMEFRLNVFPVHDGVSAHISPRELVTGLTIDANKHCAVSFGAYVQTHEEHNNSMKSWTVGAIAMRPRGNHQGGHYSFSLLSRRIITRNNSTEVPMPAEVVVRLVKMAEDKNLNRLVSGDRRNGRTTKTPFRCPVRSLRKNH